MNVTERSNKRATVRGSGMEYANANEGPASAAEPKNERNKRPNTATYQQP